jgi:exosome complex RNA-binding protein Csl4
MFKRVIEDFICENCGSEVEGDGYTNHCPVCLWSLHVDNEPGDRANNCNGLMEPFNVLYTSNESKLEHKCTKCGMIKKNKVSKRDEPNAIAKIH